MGSEDQALTVQSKKNRRDYHHSKGKHPPSIKAQLRYYTCDEIGHYARDCPRNKINPHKKKNNKRRHHAHAAKDDEPSSKRNKQQSDDSSSDEEYVLIFALTGNITHGSNDWIIKTGASKHMKIFIESFVKLSEHESPHKVKLGYDYQYPIKGSGEYSYKLDSGKSLAMKEVLFVLGIKKNILGHISIGCKRNEGCIHRWSSHHVAKSKYY